MKRQNTRSLDEISDPDEDDAVKFARWKVVRQEQAIETGEGIATDDEADELAYRSLRAGLAVSREIVERFDPHTRDLLQAAGSNKPKWKAGPGRLDAGENDIYAVYPRTGSESGAQDVRGGLETRGTMKGSTLPPRASSATTHRHEMFKEKYLEPIPYQQRLQEISLWKAVGNVSDRSAHDLYVGGPGEGVDPIKLLSSRRDRDTDIGPHWKAGGGDGGGTDRSCHSLYEPGPELPPEKDNKREPAYVGPKWKGTSTSISHHPPASYLGASESTGGDATWRLREQFGDMPDMEGWKPGGEPEHVVRRAAMDWGPYGEQPGLERTSSKGAACVLHRRQQAPALTSLETEAPAPVATKQWEYSSKTFTTDLASFQKAGLQHSTTAALWLKGGGAVGDGEVYSKHGWQGLSAAELAGAGALPGQAQDLAQLAMLHHDTYQGNDEAPTRPNSPVGFMGPVVEEMELMELLTGARLTQAKRTSAPITPRLAEMMAALHPPASAVTATDPSQAHYGYSPHYVNHAAAGAHQDGLEACAAGGTTPRPEQLPGNTLGMVISAPLARASHPPHPPHTDPTASEPHPRAGGHPQHAHPGPGRATHPTLPGASVSQHRSRTVDDLLAFATHGAPLPPPPTCSVQPALLPQPLQPRCSDHQCSTHSGASCPTKRPTESRATHRPLPLTHSVGFNPQRFSPASSFHPSNTQFRSCRPQATANLPRIQPQLLATARRPTSITGRPPAAHGESTSRAAGRLLAAVKSAASPDRHRAR
ncbi:MAG: hypothetical protein WDW38_004772 [Sanguina aurantia]